MLGEAHEELEEQRSQQLGKDGFLHRNDRTLKTPSVELQTALSHSGISKLYRNIAEDAVVALMRHIAMKTLLACRTTSWLGFQQRQRWCMLSTLTSSSGFITHDRLL